MKRLLDRRRSSHRDRRPRRGHRRRPRSSSSATTPPPAPTASAPRMREALGDAGVAHARSHRPGLRCAATAAGPTSTTTRRPTATGGRGSTRSACSSWPRRIARPGQALYRNPTLLAQIDAALAYTKTFYGATIIPTGNWWFWTIGIPIDLGPTLVLMRGEIESGRRTTISCARSISASAARRPARGIVGPVPTGENLVWSSFTHLCLALLKNDAAMLAAVRDAMAPSRGRPSAKGSSATARSISTARSSTPAATAARSRTTSRATR